MTDLRNRRIALPAIATSALFAAACSSSDSPIAFDATAPTVDSVVQDRGADGTGRTIAVTFSEAVTAATAEVAGNYTVSGGANVTTATLRVDERTVDLLLDALAIPGTATVDIAAGIEDAAGNTSVLAASQALTSTDATAPAASAIAATAVEGASNDRIVVTFDDDMIGAEVEDLANWTLESPVGTSFDPTGATIAYDAMTRQAQITLTAGANDRNLETGDAIAATFTTMRDVAGNVVTATTIGSDAVNGTVDGDVSSPALLSIVPGAGNTAVLTFTEEVKRMETADQGANGTRIVLTDNSDPGVAATGSVTLTGFPQDGDSVTISDGTDSVTFEFELGATGTVTLADLPNDADSVTIDDGTSSVTFEFDSGGGVTGTPVTIGADAAETAGNLITAVGASGLSVTAGAGATAEGVFLRNAAGGTGGNVAITSVNVSGNITVAGMTGGGVTGGAVSVAIDSTSVANTAGNLLAAVNSDAFAVTATVGGTSEAVNLTNDSAGLAGNVAISESDPTSVIHQLGMAGGVDPGTATFTATASTATAASGSPFQADVTFGVQPAAGDSIFIIGTTDLAGNQMFPVTNAPVVAAVATAPALTGGTAVTAVSGERNDTVVAEFGVDLHPRAAIDPANFTLTDGVTPIDLATARFEQTQPNEVTIQLEGAAQDVQNASTYTLSVNGLASDQGVEMIAASDLGSLTPAGDATAPTVGASDVRIDPTNVNALLVTFDEAVSVTGATDTASYTMAGRVTNTAVMVSPRVVRVTFDTQPAVSDNLDIAVAALTDLAGNAAVAASTIAVAAADPTAPTVASVTATTDPDGVDRIVVVFDEPVVPAEAVLATNYTVTLDGAPVALTGATISYSSVAQTVTMDLPMSFTLTNSGTVAVTPAGISDVAGNVIVAAASNATVSGDAVALASATGFVNLIADGLGQVIDVDFGEPVTAGTAGLAANWASNGGQTATAAAVLENGLVRVTFDGPIGASDIITASNISDLAGNVTASIAFDPID